MDGYRADYQRGKTLNDDQKAAIAKYDEVLQTLEFARELSAQFKTLAIEEEKTRKKQIKKDLQERNKAEIERIASTIESRFCLEDCELVHTEIFGTLGKLGTLETPATFCTFGTMETSGVNLVISYVEK